MTFPGRLQPGGSRARHQHLWFASVRPTQTTGHAVMRRLSLDCKSTSGGSRTGSRAASPDKLSDRAPLGNGPAKEVSLQPMCAVQLAWADLLATGPPVGLTLQRAPSVYLQAGRACSSHMHASGIVFA